MTNRVKVLREIEALRYTLVRIDRDTDQAVQRRIDASNDIDSLESEQDDIRRELTKLETLLSTLPEEET
jgi:chromosome segregation ATPase